MIGAWTRDSIHGTNSRNRFTRKGRINSITKERSGGAHSGRISVPSKTDRGEAFSRPVLILRGFSDHVCLIVPLTTSKKPGRYRVSLGYLGDKESFAIISQMRLIDTKRFYKPIGRIDRDRFSFIRKAARDLF
ncbi:MAG: type II toxin-antitoxin system PemK/MazF family toxin [Patescibacteria group bacterium]|nr:type II toxin-antitoxin system PemK/MazF family toxin [Patescibacteria group bacterium]